jgi:ElaB/YqjD/DUF883 family membrane-anchored ribosome-binding protein
MAAAENNSYAPSSNGNSDSSQRINLVGDVQDILSPLKESVGNVLEENKAVGADKLKMFADAINGAAPGLEAQMPQVASYIREAGAWVEQSADNVRNQKFEEILESAGTFARNNPAVAFGIAALSGFALSRFFKSQRPAVTVASAPTTSN